MDVRRFLLRSATRISPKINNNIRYFNRYGCFPNRKNPKTFEEKLLVLKEGRYAFDPLVARCSDKYWVREHVIERGCGRYLNELYCHYNLGDSIKWELLPQQFVMKLSAGCGLNYFCHDKESQLPEIQFTANSWVDYDHEWLNYAEMQYESIEPVLLFEKYLDIHCGNAPEDYKVYCFNGVPLAILVISDRFSIDGWSVYFMSPEWDFLGMPDRFGERKPSKIANRPDCLNEMLEASKRLSNGFPFVRVDFYIVDDRPIFGEMTFTPRSCIGVHEIELNGHPMGDYLHLEG